MKNQPFKEDKKVRFCVMIALIVTPFLLAALLWWILPSGHRANIEKKEGLACKTNFWHPLQPAIKLGTGIFIP